MPLIYRSMARDGDWPKIGPTARTLGARIPGDLPVRDDRVEPGTGGMSVARGWRDPPAWRIPIRLIHLAPKAAGRHQDVFCWSMGQGPFIEGDVADRLRLRPDDATHALVEPSERMTVEEYQTALAATQNLWHIDED
jgi:hypothetical protein